MLSAFRNFFLTFVIAALIFGGIAYFVVGFVLETVSEAIEPESVETEKIHLEYSDTTDEPPSTDTTPPPDEEPISGESFNILLIGTDYQPELFDDYDYESTWTGEGFPDKRDRPWGADSLILVRIDKESRRFVFCAIPRNTRVQVDGIYTQLGDIIASKGVEFLCGKVTGLTGMKIDYYAQLDIGSLAACIDALGGITYYIPEDMTYSDPLQELEIDLKKGTAQIDGNMAMQLLRYVGYEGGDTARMRTAVDFLQKIIAKFTNVTYLTKAPELYKTLTRYIKTDFSADDLLNNLDLIFAYTKFETLVLSFPGSVKAYDGISYFEPNTSAALELFEGCR